MADGASHTAAPTARKMQLPAGRMAELRHLQFDADMDCWTVRCGCCGEDLPADPEFWPFDGRLPGPWCKACRAEKAARWYKERGRAQRKARRAGAA